MGRYVAKSGSEPLGSNYGDAVGLLFIGRLLPLAIRIGLLFAEVLGMGGTVTITAGLFLSAGFHTGVRDFDFHVKPSKNYLMVVPYGFEP